MNETNEPEINCPVDCPNRASNVDASRGKWGAYLFALFLGALVLAFTFEERDGKWRSVDNPPVALYAVFLPAIGLCLGVQISPESVGKLLGK